MTDASHLPSLPSQAQQGELTPSGSDDKWLDDGKAQDTEGRSQSSQGYEDDFLRITKKENVKQGLLSRHLQMMSLAGAIGGGLFISTGYSLANAGPVGMLLAYVFMGSIVISVVLCMAELSSLAPTTGSYVRHTAMFVDPALGCSTGWNMVFGSAISTPSTIISLVVLCQYWNQSLNPAIPISIFIVATFASNAGAVRVYGEIEFIFSIMKILTVAGLIVFSICIAAGAGPNGDATGFRYWKDPGPFASYLVGGGIGKFVGFWSTMTSAVYSFVGIESTAIVAAETKSPRQTIPRASKRVFWRVGFIYIASLFAVSLIVPSNDERLVEGSGTASTSPFVIGAERAGVKSLASLLNALALLSAWSSGNTSLLNGSRALTGLALDGNAPKIFTKTQRWGVPHYSIAFLAIFMPLAYTACSASATTVFGYLISVASSSALVEWMAICFTSGRLHRALKVQGIPKSRLPFVPFLQPYLAWYGFAGSLLVCITGGFTLFIGEGLPNFTAQGFLSAYAMPLINIIVYAGYKIVRRTKVVRAKDIPVEAWLAHWKANPEAPLERTVGWRKVLAIVGF
ncbi:unnamed protein product [Sympodiomycopsis kandeliae]